jgi:hypothetical protein
VHVTLVGGILREGKGTAREAALPRTRYRNVCTAYKWHEVDTNSIHAGIPLAYRVYGWFLAGFHSPRYRIALGNFLGFRFTCQSYLGTDLHDCVGLP